MTTSDWNRFQEYLCDLPEIGLTVDISRMFFDSGFLQRMQVPMDNALSAMTRLEAGEKANIDEGRMVGHYWLRNPSHAPGPDIRKDIEKTIAAVNEFAEQVHSCAIRPTKADAFDILLCIGIGGSALGPQLLSDALGSLDDVMLVRFLDNTDPDGIRRTLSELDDSLERVLTIVTSKSGTTAETRNGMLETAAAFHRRNLSFPRHAVAITQEGSQLHQQAVAEHWLATFPMWDFVGGRTSITSAAGLLPAALQGFDVTAFLRGAAECDQATREPDFRKNPAALLALMWHYAGNGRGDRNMVILPYCDRLGLFGRYLQQLVMESIGKERNRKGDVVHQGLTVFGNKGSTDQHSYVQQLREGRNDFFVTFMEVLSGPGKDANPINDSTRFRTGDDLHGFLYGTRAALMEAGRESITITLDRLDSRRLGTLIALFERAVGLYAELIDLNAYHQPGVEAGKKAARNLVNMQEQVVTHLRNHPGDPQTATQIAAALRRSDSTEEIFLILRRLAANRIEGIRSKPARPVTETQFHSSDS